MCRRARCGAFLPPLVIEKEHIDEAVNALDEFLNAN